MKKILPAFFLFLILNGIVFSQTLDKISPVILQQGTPAKGVSFILTTTDCSFFREKPQQFENNIQIIDAGQPWPPRWFSAVPFDTSMGLPYSALIPLNASYQNKKFSFFTIIKYRDGHNAEIYRHCFVLCDSNLAITDTFIQPGYDLDHHDLKIDANGEKLFFALHDTLLNLGKFHNSAKDTSINLFYEKIEITDSTGRICFSWNPIKELGPDAPYRRYWNTKGVWSSPDIFDWSHGNSLCFDYDGNILYSYKFIGIGKISRKDGHIMWRVDRHEPQPNLFSDTMPIFLQHDLQCARDESGNQFYTFLSNGDGANRFCSVCQFTVKDTLNGQKIFRIKKRWQPSEEIPNTGGGGNYDLERNGNYVVNYGNYKADSSRPRTLFDYRNIKNKILGRYTISPYVLAYRVHKLNNWCPSRPEVKRNKRSLSVSSENETIWYKLDSKNHEATLAGRGKSFSPQTPGIYCAAVKYGIGYAVSIPVSYHR